MRLGPELKHAIDHEDLSNGFLIKTSNFLIELATQFQKRFIFDGSEVWKVARCLNPKHALSQDFHKKNPLIIEQYIQVFKYLIKSEQLKMATRRTWNELPTLEVPLEVRQNIKDSEEFWRWAGCVKIGGEARHKLYFGIACYVWTIAPSTAEPERKWSHMKNKKPKHKSNMNIKTLNGTMLADEAVDECGKAHEFEATESMLKFYLSKEYYQYGKKAPKKD